MLWRVQLWLWLWWSCWVRSLWGRGLLQVICCLILVKETDLGILRSRWTRWSHPGIFRFLFNTLSLLENFDAYYCYCSKVRSFILHRYVCYYSGKLYIEGIHMSPLLFSWHSTIWSVNRLCRSVKGSPFGGFHWDGIVTQCFLRAVVIVNHLNDAIERQTCWYPFLFLYFLLDNNYFLLSFLTKKKLKFCLLKYIFVVQFLFIMLHNYIFEYYWI